MSLRRVVTLLLLVALAIVLVACGSDDNTDSGNSGTQSGDNAGAAPVDLGNVTNKGSKDLGSSMSATLELEADDNYFKPTFIKAAPGAKVSVEMKNEGSATHTFTIDGTSIDKDLEPDATATAEVTVPSSGALEFHCRFHGGAGMKGAFYTKDGDTVTNASATGADSNASTTAAGGLYP
jgi:plastocyanin